MTRTTLRGSYRAKQRRTQHQSLWKKLNRERQFSKIQGYAFAFVVILIAGILGTIYLIPTFTSQPNPYYRQWNGIGLNPNDPTSYLWYDTAPSSNLNEFNTQLATFGSGLGSCGAGGTTCIVLAPNSTNPALALSKVTTQSFGVVNGKILIINMAFWSAIGVCCGNMGHDYGYYLTTNGTMPSALQKNYNPFTDRNVVLLTKGNAQGGGLEQLATFINKNPGVDTISSEVPSCFPSQASSSYICGSLSTLNSGQMNTWLNYTSTTNSLHDCSTVFFLGNGCSFIVYGTGGSTTGVSTQSYPAFPTSGSYYIGFYADTGFGGPISFLFDQSFPDSACSINGCMSVQIFTPTPAVQVNVPPAIDTGGFFGPVIKFFINGLTIALAIIIGFFSYLYGLIVPILAGLASIIGGFLVTILNAFGNIFGDNALGTQINTAFTNIFSYLNQIFSTAVSIWSNILTTLANFVTFVTKFFTGNPFIAFIENFIAQAPNFWTVLNGVWADIMQYYISGVFTIQTVLVFWYLFGIFEVWKSTMEGDGLKGFFNWLKITEVGFFGIFKAGYWILDEAYSFIVQLKQLLFGNTVSPVKVAGTG